ncbi:kelch-like [Seminavis robusta]|uniref:Kelch-like n=1 Tax=Seminavis robusta TaxID=568900 RepID=A0A9N8EMY2_9STRA|nr:kelch-like [Seminavis robusta]|eukprot:Sro1440_g272830.1 kelch-like (494) ;mRNA; f:7208-8771
MMIGNLAHRKFFATIVLLAVSSSHAVPDMRFGDANTEIKLPKPLSDVSATVGPDDLIYIAGGCDSPFGNQYDEDRQAFRCESVSDAFYAFDPETKEFEVLPPMPGPRYRHAAVAINNQLWLVGGRDANDQVVGSVVVFDFEDMRWRLFNDLHWTYSVSDVGGFAARGRAYFVGGFSPNYRTVKRVFSIDPVASWDLGELDIIRHPNMNHRRGDLGIIVDEEEKYAYVSGGSSHTNQFCSPLDSAERFDIENDVWEEVAPLQQARTGKSVLEIDHQVVAIGGAQEMGKLCDKTNPDPSQFQTPVYSIEVYDNGRWDVVDRLTEYRFRSTSVVFNETIYSFGGQSVYFSVCMCHPTVDDVVIYELIPQEPTLPDYVVNMDTDYNPRPSTTVESQIDTSYNSVGAGVGGPGSDVIMERGNFNDDPANAEKDNYEETESEFGAKEPETATDSALSGGGFGGYHRESNGVGSASSSAVVQSLESFIAVTMGAIAVLML